MKGRGSQRGGLSKRNRSWTVSFRRHVVDERGDIAYRRTMQRIGPCLGPDKLSKADAQREADRIVSEANALAAVPQMMATLQQFVDVRWIPERVDHLRPATRDFYETMLSHILPSLGPLALKDITPPRVQILLSAKSKVLSKRTVTGIRDCLTGIYKHAKRLGFWPGDIPTEGLAANGADPKEARALSAEQKELWVHQVPLRYRPLLSFLSGTGLRIGEALGLRWKYANLSDHDIAVDGILIPENCIAIVQSYGKFGWGPVKKSRSRRIIPLVAQAKAALLQMQERDLSGGPDDPIFRARTGNPWDASNIAQDFLKPAARALGFGWASWHTFRHSMNGLDTATRKVVLGHASEAQTLDYTHQEIKETRRKMETVQ